jgi:hypothetical protein
MLVTLLSLSFFSWTKGQRREAAWSYFTVFFSVEMETTQKKIAFNTTAYMSEPFSMPVGRQ